MKIAKLMIASLVVLLPLMAQKEKTEENKSAEAQPHDWPVKLFQVKYANVYQLAKVFNAFGAIINADNDLKVISVRAPKEVLVAIEESIKRLDVPQPASKNIAVVQQLKNIFKYSGFRLIATSSLRMRDGSGGETNGILPSVGTGLMPTTYEFRVGSSAITSDSKERAIRIDGLRLGLRVPLKAGESNWQYQEAHINTSIDIREGQKVVVGKANIDNADNALILVLTAKVIE